MISLKFPNVKPSNTMKYKKTNEQTNSSYFLCIKYNFWVGGGADYRFLTKDRLLLSIINLDRAASFNQRSAFVTNYQPTPRNIVNQRSALVTNYQPRPRSIVNQRSTFVTNYQPRPRSIVNQRSALVTNYQPRPRSILDERKPRLHRGGSVKYRMFLNVRIIG